MVYMYTSSHAVVRCLGIQWKNCAEHCALSSVSARSTAPFLCLHCTSNNTVPCRTELNRANLAPRLHYLILAAGQCNSYSLSRCYSASVWLQLGAKNGAHVSLALLLLFHKYSEGFPILYHVAV